MGQKKVWNGSVKDDAKLNEICIQSTPSGYHFLDWLPPAVHIPPRQNPRDPKVCVHPEYDRFPKNGRKMVATFYKFRQIFRKIN